MTISNEQSRKIYEIATHPKNKLSNRQIGEMYGVGEASVRHHVKKWDNALRGVAKWDENVASAMATHLMNVHTESMEILTAVKSSIMEARANGVKPERLVGLYLTWIRSLELVSELMGDIDRRPEVSVNVTQQFNEFMQVVLQETDAGARSRIVKKLGDAIDTACIPIDATPRSALSSVVDIINTERARDDEEEQPDDKEEQPGDR